MHTFKTEAIVLKRSNFGEADKIITFYTPCYGKIVCLAKGVRKMTSRKKGSLEIFNKVVLFAVKGKGMNIITEVETLNTFSSWKDDLKKIITAYQASELVDKLTVEEHEQEEVYFLLSSFFENLTQLLESETKFAVDRLSQNILMALGFWQRGKPFPSDFNTLSYVEEIIEKEIKSRRCYNKV